MSKTEQRTAPRVAVSAQGTLQVLGSSTEGNLPAEPVQIIDVSTHGMRLRSATAATPGQAVKVEMGEAMFLGEVCYCAAQEGQGFAIGIATEQCLTGLSGLQHLIRALSQDPAPSLLRR